MVGTGVFTSLGFQLNDIQSGFVLLLLWAVGGLAAFCGALSYAELGATFPRSGGEYHFLSQTIHPAAGFVGGWVSATIGFAAPTALAAITFGKYLASVFPGLPVRTVACALVVVVGLVHASSRRNSGGMQRWFTALKVILIVGFCIAAMIFGQQPQPIQFIPQAGDWSLITSSPFAVGLIYVSYAYTGWNAATYLSSEVANPQRNLPIVLAAGTAIVLLLYLALNATFLLAAPASDMAGQVEIGYIAAEAAFGVTGGKLMGGMLALLLISTVSAMLLAGPRVLHVIGQDFSIFRWLAQTNRQGLPQVAIGVQSAVALIFILTGTFESILVFAGFTLAVVTFATVSGLLWVRWRQPDLPRPFRSPGYPLPSLIYLALTGWTLWFVVWGRPQQGLAGLGVLAVGFAVYFVVRYSQRAAKLSKTR